MPDPGAWGERELLRAVLRLADLYGWWAYHQRPALTRQGYRTALQGDAGFPDLVLVRAPRVIFAELKSPEGRLTRDQDGWIAALEGCPDVETYIWRPADLEAIEGALRR